MITARTTLRRTLFTPALAAAVWAAPSSGPAQPPESPDFGLFVPLEAQNAQTGAAGAPPRPEPVDVPRHVLRRRAVNLDLRLLSELTDALWSPDPRVRSIRVNLFPDVVPEALVEWRDFGPAGHSWAGGIVDDPTGSVAFGTSGDAIHGIVRTRGRVYKLTSSGGRVRIEEIDPRALPPGGPPIRAGAAADSGTPTRYVDDPGRVDIAVFYTRAAERHAGGADEIEAVVDAWIADTNAAYARSAIEHRLNLVHRERVSYTEETGTEDEPSGSLALDCLADDDDGCIDGIHAVRAEMSADLVHLIIANTEVEHQCGVAYMTGDYGVSELRCGSSTFAHEVGHNSGVNHDRYVEYDEACETDALVPCFTDTPAPYAYGYVNQPALSASIDWQRRWRTLMSYSSQCSDLEIYCPEIMRFSNPSQEWFGDRLGVMGERGPSSFTDAADAAKRGPADAARVHREYALDLANRVTRDKPDLTVRGFRAQPSTAPPGGTVTLSAIVENLGLSTGTTGLPNVTFCRATTAKCTSAPSARRIGSPTRIPPLETNERAVFSTTVDLGTGTGRREYRACVGPAPGGETERNNCSDPVAVTVGEVDLSVSATISKSTADPSEALTISSAVRNAGSADSTSVRVFYAYCDPADCEWEYFGGPTRSSVGAGSTWRPETAFDAPADAGTYQYHACIVTVEQEFDGSTSCSAGVRLTVSGTAPPTGGSWSRTGVGNTVFEVPDHVRHVDVTGEYSGYASNFVVWCGQGSSDRGGLLVNELLGTGFSTTRVTLSVSALRSYFVRGEPCGWFSIEDSEGVSWSFRKTAPPASGTQQAAPGDYHGDVRAVQEALERVEGQRRRLGAGRRSR